MSNRQSIPSDLKRSVFVEAGHRCAIPRCLKHPVDIHHIVPYEKCKNHSFDNLIVLCTQCHARFHRTKEIDIKSLKKYKSNLSLVNGRYSHFEKRVLQYFLDKPDDCEIELWGRELDILFLVRDNLLQKQNIKRMNAINFPPTIYVLTEEGKIFIQMWANNESLE